MKKLLLIGVGTFLICAMGPCPAGSGGSNAPAVPLTQELFCQKSYSLFQQLLDTKIDEALVGFKKTSDGQKDDVAAAASAFTISYKASLAKHVDADELKKCVSRAKTTCPTTFQKSISALPCLAYDVPDLDNLGKVDTEKTAELKANSKPKSEMINDVCESFSKLPGTLLVPIFVETSEQWRTDKNPYFVIVQPFSIYLGVGKSSDSLLFGGAGMIRDACIQTVNAKCAKTYLNTSDMLACLALK